MRTGVKQLLTMAGCAALLIGAGVATAGVKKTPYWASLSHDEARMRVGPSLDYPSSWVYRRRDLPVKVVQVLGLWRKIEDPDGAQGWMHVRLLSDAETGIVSVPMAELHESASAASQTIFRAEKGVVGRLSGCSGGWCNMDVRGKRGYVRASDIWGATGA